ncbi:hypothetical protein Lal_00041687 [Lupinus albus]|nr:hypothetical protein Lal_00041687 [Lupinus albus]
MERGHLTQHEQLDKRKKGISIKATTLKIQEEKPYDDDSDSSEIDDETIALIVIKFSKFLKKMKGAFIRLKQKESGDSTKKGKNTKKNITFL